MQRQTSMLESMLLQKCMTLPKLSSILYNQIRTLIGNSSSPYKHCCRAPTLFHMTIYWEQKVVGPHLCILQTQIEAPPQHYFNAYKKASIWKTHTNIHLWLVYIALLCCKVWTVPCWFVFTYSSKSNFLMMLVSVFQSPHICSVAVFFF